MRQYGHRVHLVANEHESPLDEQRKGPHRDHQAAIEVQRAGGNRSGGSVRGVQSESGLPAGRPAAVLLDTGADLRGGVAQPQGTGIEGICQANHSQVQVH